MDAETKVESVPANEDSAREKSSKGSIQLMEGYVVKEVVEDDSQVDQTEIPPESDLSLTERRIWVVTTASLPWRTGTFVNPLARALCLTRGRPKDYVTLLIPWLPKQADQLKIFGDECTFDKEEDQEKWVRQYCKEQAHCEKEAENLRIRFYPATYHAKFGSIFATVDICALVPDEEADVVILEEPEHLTWFRVPPPIDDETLEESASDKIELGWAAKFDHVVGIRQKVVTMDAETKVESAPANEDSAREISSKGSIQLKEDYGSSLEQKDEVKEVVEDDPQVDQTEITPESDLSLTEVVEIRQKIGTMDAETKVESVPANEDSARETSSKGSNQLKEDYGSSLGQKDEVREVVEDDSQVDQTEITTESDLSLTERRIWVVTTASLPWRTGTSVNPLARALYLTRGRPKDYVTLLIPWLPKQADQLKIFGDGCTFDKEEDQEKWVRQYCKERVHCEKEAENLRIRFYPATYHAKFGSIFATVDICALVPDEEADVAILEEPEHLTWFRVPPPIDDKTLEESARDKIELGWAAKFNHVVGILHTNYSAYVNQYGMGPSFIAASALDALSKMVVRGYCHKLIRLSATLPELDKTKEVTCNVHGVRSEFFDAPDGSTTTGGTTDEQPSPIYFIGKLIWAKGFDKLLEIQDMFREATDEYFSMDVYGLGDDEKAIKRAFFGRKGISIEAGKQQNDKVEQEAGDRISQTDRTALSIFSSTGSLRDQLDDTEEGGIEVVLETATNSENIIFEESQVESSANPFAILGDLSGKTLNTGVAATKAGTKLSEKLVDLVFHTIFSGENKEKSASPPDQEGTEKRSRPSFRFDPPRTRFELRRQPIPARFLGVKDHAMIRNIPGHKIFLNLSETEVLCTTTAEALAMGKFVIIPKHPSNDFFLQFPNCLAYSSKKECIHMIQKALMDEPEPLSEEDAYKLRWEGATERLIKSAALTTRDVENWRESGRDEEDRKLARMHIESMKKGQFVKKFLEDPRKVLSRGNTPDEDAAPILM